MLGNPCFSFVLLPGDAAGEDAERALLADAESAAAASPHTFIALVLGDAIPEPRAALPEGGDVEN